MLDLLRRDPTVRALPRWLIFAALTASVTEGARTFLTLRAARDGAELETFPLLVIALWLPFVVYLAFGQIGERCTRFDMALPVSVRTLWLTHLVGSTLSALSILALAAGVVFMHDSLVRGLPGNPPVPQPGPGGLAVRAAAALVLVLILLQSLQPSLRKLRPSRGFGLLVAAAAAGILVLMLVLAALPVAWVLVPLVAAVAVGARAYRSLPASFTLVPFAAESGAAAAGADISETAWSGDGIGASRGGGRWGSYWMICRTLYRGIAPGQLVKFSVVTWFGFPFTFLWGAHIAGLFYNDESIRMSYLVLTAYVLFCFIAGPMAQLHIFDPLPVSRKLLYAFLILPMMGVLALGYGVGRIGVAARHEPVPLVEFHADHSDACPRYGGEAPTVRVPLEFCAIAWDGQPADHVAPWGESHPAWSVPLIGESRAVLYSPFGTPPGSSPKFAALQIGRAVEAVYGESVPSEEILSRYLEVGDDDEVGWKAGGAAFRERLGGLEPRAGVKLFPLIYALISLFFLFFASLYARCFRTGVSDKLRLGLYFGILAFAMALHVVPFVFLIMGGLRDWVVTAAVKIVTRKLIGALPFGSAVVWVACLLVTLGGYLWARSRFERIEVPVPRETQEG